MIISQLPLPAGDDAVDIGYKAQVNVSSSYKEDNGAIVEALREGNVTTEGALTVGTKAYTTTLTIKRRGTYTIRVTNSDGNVRTSTINAATYDDTSFDVSFAPSECTVQFKVVKDVLNSTTYPEGTYYVEYIDDSGTVEGDKVKSASLVTTGSYNTFSVASNRKMRITYIANGYTRTKEFTCVPGSTVDLGDLVATPGSEQTFPSFESATNEELIAICKFLNSKEITTSDLPWAAGDKRVIKEAGTSIDGSTTEPARYAVIMNVGGRYLTKDGDEECNYVISAYVPAITTGISKTHDGWKSVDRTTIAPSNFIEPWNSLVKQMYVAIAPDKQTYIDALTLYNFVDHSTTKFGLYLDLINAGANKTSDTTYSIGYVPLVESLVPTSDQIITKYDGGGYERNCSKYVDDKRTICTDYDAAVMIGGYKQNKFTITDRENLLPGGKSTDRVECEAVLYGTNSTNSAVHAATDVDGTSNFYTFPYMDFSVREGNINSEIDETVTLPYTPPMKLYNRKKTDSNTIIEHYICI